jgi:hypothetical protein
LTQTHFIEVPVTRPASELSKGQTKQWPKEKRQKNKQRFKKHCTEN